MFRRWWSPVVVLCAVLIAAVVGCAPAADPHLSVNRLVYGSAGANQAVVVTAPAYGTSFGTLETFNRVSGVWVRAFPAMPARLGYNGLAAPGAKREGDGRTPTGKFAFGSFLWGARPSPGVHYAYHQLRYGDWWDEHVGSRTYNTFQYYPGLNPPFAAGSEKLWTTVPAYNYAATIAYNTAPVVQGAGSGIFLHVGTGGATAGCVSLASADLVKVLRWLDPNAHPFIAMGTSATILH
jgi:L,D-peptidoglycan transpeptidase YkuD (ErfK/YbiS/YcfS/YnhG family)